MNQHQLITLGAVALILIICGVAVSQINGAVDQCNDVWENYINKYCMCQAEPLERLTLGNWTVPAGDLG